MDGGGSPLLTGTRRVAVQPREPIKACAVSSHGVAMGAIAAMTSQAAAVSIVTVLAGNVT